ncbi:MAG: hypothetical protein EOP04_32280, partial [Proteobacteria bacterium]
MKFLLPLMFLAAPAFAQDAGLAEKFAAAGNILSSTTSAILHKPIAGYAQVVSAHADGQMATALTAGVPKSDAQVLILETSVIVENLARSILDGTRNPTVAAREKSCQLVVEGIEKRRFAPFYEGYSDFEDGFVLYFDQFVSIADI